MYFNIILPSKTMPKKGLSLPGFQIEGSFTFLNKKYLGFGSISEHRLVASQGIVPNLWTRGN
jgi:hypothetical protein